MDPVTASAIRRIAELREQSTAAHAEQRAHKQSYDASPRRSRFGGDADEGEEEAPVRFGSRLAALRAIYDASLQRSPQFARRPASIVREAKDACAHRNHYAFCRDPSEDEAACFAPSLPQQARRGAAGPFAAPSGPEALLEAARGRDDERRSADSGCGLSRRDDVAAVAAQSLAAVGVLDYGVTAILDDGSDDSAESRPTPALKPTKAPKRKRSAVAKRTAH